MKRPRPKAVLKWSGLSLCTLIFAAWLASRWAFAAVTYRQGERVWAAQVQRGRAWLAWQRRRGALHADWPEGWSASAGPNRAGESRWDLRLDRSYWSAGFSAFHHIDVPLVLPFLLLGAPTAWLFYRDRRRVPGACATCGYDLVGNTTGVCPECGRACA